MSSLRRLLLSVMPPLVGGFLFPTAGSAADYENIVLVIHGGTAPPRERLNAELEQSCRAVMLASLTAGRDALARDGAAALDGVEAAIRVLEDSPLFNAGRGAVFTADERIELDASIMDGRDLKAGALAGLTIVKNPITAARAVMERSKHVLLIGHGAEEFCRQEKLELVDPSYFRTQDKLDELHRVQAAEKAAAGDAGKSSSLPRPAIDVEYGTVGAVALDRLGHLAAGTSTGGMTNKKHGRVGDSPIIGAGTYADDRSCGVSCTGHGEYFIRLSVAQSIASRVRLLKQSVDDAGRIIVHDELGPAGGVGGVIVLDPSGHAAFAWNAPGLWHGWLTRDGRMHVAVYE